MEQQHLLCDLPGQLGFMPSSQTPHRVWVITHLYRRGQGIRTGKPFAQNQKRAAKLESKRRSGVGHVIQQPSLQLLYLAESLLPGQTPLHIPTKMTIALLKHFTQFSPLVFPTTL